MEVPTTEAQAILILNTQATPLEANYPPPIQATHFLRPTSEFSREKILRALPSSGLTYLAKAMGVAMKRKLPSSGTRPGFCGEKVRIPNLLLRCCRFL